MPKESTLAKRIWVSDRHCNVDFVLGDADCGWLLDAGEARKILGAGAIIGVTCSSVTEAKIAIEKGANYLGIGTIYHTPT